MYYLWLDDYRDVSDDFKHRAYRHTLIKVTNYDEFVAVVTQRGCPVAISFDHDLVDCHYAGDFSREHTGYDCAKWFGEWLLSEPSRLRKDFQFFVHSKNPVGAANIVGYLEPLLRHVRN